MKKKTEFSKKIIIFMTVFILALTIYSLCLMWKTGDTSPLSYLIPSVFAEYATATGFYYWKARTENKIKLMKRHGSMAERAINNDDINNYNGGY